MAGETAVVYEEPVYEHETPAPVATTWLISLWIGAATAAAAGLAWAMLTPNYGLSGLLVYATSVAFGSPLFIVTWLWLDRSVVCRHGPFLLLIAFWVGTLVVAMSNGDSRVLRLAPAAVPLISCVALVLVVLGVRARQASYFQPKTGS